MRKLADQLHVTSTTIYNYYKNKDELCLVILTKAFEALYQACLAAAGESGPGGANLCHGSGVYRFWDPTAQPIWVDVCQHRSSNIMISKVLNLR